MKSSALLFTLLGIGSLLQPAASHAVQATVRCNPTMNNGVILFGLAPDAVARLAAVAKDPKADPALYESLWAPKGVSPRFGGTRITLDAAQDMDEIATAMRADPLLAALGVTSVDTEAGILLAAERAGVILGGPFPVAKIATEYRDTIRDHYYWASGPDELEFIDAGGAGPGWIRTGERIVVHEASLQTRFDYPVWEFYRASTGSHFITTSPDECGALRRSEAASGWQLVNRPYALPIRFIPAGATCSGTDMPFYRLRNGKVDDPAYRYTTKVSIREEMRAQGWSYEGVAMCVTPAP